MKLSHKLDVLQGLAVEYANDPRKLYLVSLLVEHIEEELPVDFLAWFASVLEPTNQTSQSETPY